MSDSADTTVEAETEAAAKEAGSGDSRPPLAVSAGPGDSRPPLAGPLTDADRDRGMTWAIIVSVFNMLAVQCFVDKFLQLYALRLGAAPQVLGTIVLCLKWASLARLPAAARVERRGKKKTLVSEWGAAVAAAALIVLAPQAGDWAGPLLPESLAPAMAYLHPTDGAAVFCVLAGATLFNLLQQGGSTGWFPLLQDVVPEQGRGRFFGMLRSTWQATNKGFLLVDAWYLGTAPTVGDYQVLMAVGLACATLRVFALLNIPEVPRPPKPSAPWWREVAVPLTDARFRGFLMFTATYYVALGMVETFTLVYLAELGFSPRTLNLCIAAGSLGAVLSLFGWGRLADLVGGRPVFGMCSLTVAGLMVAWQFVRPFSPAAVGTETASAVGVALLLFTLMGIFDGGFGLSQTRQAMGLVPRTHQAIYFSLHTVAIQGTMGVGAFIAGHFTALAATAAPGWFGLGWDAYRWLFLGSVPVFLLAAWLNGLVAPETDRSTREVVGKAVAYPTAALWGIVRRR